MRIATPIGWGGAAGRRHALIAAAIAVASLTVDLVLSSRSVPYLARGLAAAVALALLAAVPGSSAARLGLRWRPLQGFAHWARVTLWIGLIVAAILVAVLGVAWLIGYDVPVYVTSPAEVPEAFLHSCVMAPLVEETVYRLLFCAGLVGVLGGWTTVILSGVVFGALHVVYGNPSPENLLGGLFLAWGYLKSGSVVVPVTMHALGNLVVLAGQVAAGV